MTDKSVRLWNPADGKEVKNLGTHNGSVYSVAFSPDGKLLASAGSDNLIKIWDVAGQKEIRQLKGHEMGVTGIVFAGDNDTLVSISQDRTMRVWNLKNPLRRKRSPKKKNPKKNPRRKRKKDAKERREKKDAKKEREERGAQKKEEPKKEFKDPAEIKRFGPTPDDLYGVHCLVEGCQGDRHGRLCGEYFAVGLERSGSRNSPRSRKSLAYCVIFSPDGKAHPWSGHYNGFVIVTPFVAGK